MKQTKSNTTDTIKEEGKQAAKKAARHPWVEKVMRLGFAVRGIVYGLVGLLAIQVAIGGQGRFTDQQGAIATIGAQPFGKILLILIVIGLAGYALWGFIRALLDPLNKGNDTKGLVTRAGYFISGVSYSALTIPTLRLLLSQPGGAESGSSQSANQQAVSGLLSTPLGPWLVGAIGLAIAGAGIAQMVKGYKADFDMRFDAFALDENQRKWATRLGRFGYITRGIVFALIGVFFIQAAASQNPGRVRGIDGALRELAMQPYGQILLAVVAAGLIAFGAYSLLGAAWFRFKKS